MPVRLRCRAVALAAVLVCALVAGAGPATAVTLPPTSSPLSPLSGFQGGDGNQTDEAPSVDWAGIQAQGRVLHIPDPNVSDDAFAGGDKEDEPGRWSLTTETGG